MDETGGLEMGEAERWIRDETEGWEIIIFSAFQPVLTANPGENRELWHFF